MSASVLVNQTVQTFSEVSYVTPVGRQTLYVQVIQRQADSLCPGHSKADRQTMSTSFKGRQTVSVCLCLGQADCPDIFEE